MLFFFLFKSHFVSAHYIDNNAFSKLKKKSIKKKTNKLQRDEQHHFCRCFSNWIEYCSFTGFSCYAYSNR